MFCRKTIFYRGRQNQNYKIPMVVESREVIRVELDGSIKLKFYRVKDRIGCTLLLHCEFNEMPGWRNKADTEIYYCARQVCIMVG